MAAGFDRLGNYFRFAWKPVVSHTLAAADRQHPRNMEKIAPDSETMDAPKRLL